MSTAEIVFNDSIFALLPGQGMFVKSQVPISGTVGCRGSGAAGGRKKLDSRSHLCVGKTSRWEEKRGLQPVLWIAGRGSPRAQGTLQKFGGISPLLYPFSFLSPLDADQSRTI